jgi:hypothetical protein
VRLYGEETAMKSYQAYFARLALIHGDGAQSTTPTLPFQWAPELAVA